MWPMKMDLTSIEHLTSLEYSEKLIAWLGCYDDNGMLSVAKAHGFRTERELRALEEARNWDLNNHINRKTYHRLRKQDFE